jgi:hypothetical protein
MLATVEKPPEVSRFACWSLCALGDVTSRPVILRRLQRPDAAQETTLYYGLARLGALEDLVAILAAEESPQSAIRANRALRGLARAAFAPDPNALEAAVRVLVKHYHDAEPSPEDQQWLVRSLMELDLLTPGRAPVAAAALAELLLERPETSFEIMLLRAIALTGPGSDSELSRRLTEHLANRLTGPSPSRTYTQVVGNALASADPEAARVALRAYLDDLGPQARGLARVVARSLARAGDRTAIEQHALALSREELVNAPTTGAQFTALVNVASDLLEAGRYDEDIIERRRVRRASPYDWAPLYNLGCLHALAGRQELGWRYLRRSLRHMGDPLELVTDPDLTSLRGDPRMQRAISRMALQWETGMPPPQDGWGPPAPPPNTATGGG